MDLFDVLKSCARRWYVVLPIILGAAWLAFANYAAVKPVYYSNVVVGIAPPNMVSVYVGEGVPVPKNGLLEVGGPDVLANMTVLGFGDPVVRANVLAQGGRGNYTVRMFPSPLTGAGASAQLPLIMVEATEEEAELATRTVSLAAGQADSVLHKLQQSAGVSEPLMAKAIVLSPPAATLGVPSRKRVAVGTVVAGLVLGIIVGVGLDSLVTRLGVRKRNRHLFPGQSKSETVHAASPESQDGQPLTFA